MNRKCQIILCKCGQQIAGCWEPYCYTEKDWLKTIRKYSLKGYKIELVEQRLLKLDSCNCTKKK